MTTTYDLYEIPVDAIVERGYFESSFVDKIAYDRDGQICYVVLHGDGYAYTGVPYAEFFKLFNADSVGHQYHEFSKQYGPGTYLDTGWDFVLRDDVKNSVTESDEAEETSTPTLEEQLFPGELTSVDYDEESYARFKALECAVVVYQGRKTRGGEVINLAKRFEEYLNGTN